MTSSTWQNRFLYLGGRYEFADSRHVWEQIQFDQSLHCGPEGVGEGVAVGGEVTVAVDLVVEVDHGVESVDDHASEVDVDETVDETVDESVVVDSGFVVVVVVVVGMTVEAVADSV